MYDEIDDLNTDSIHQLSRYKDNGFQLPQYKKEGVKEENKFGKLDHTSNQYYFLKRDT